MAVPSFVKTFANYTYENFAKKPGKMLLWVGVIGWVLSSLAQVTAVVINNKIPNDQKKFLIPQEMADAAVNILSFFVLTKSVTHLGESLVKSGKLATPGIRNFLKNNNLEKEVCKKGFNIPDSNAFKNDKTFQNEYFKFADGVSFISSTIGSIVSCNIITPILRNKFAAARQKADIEKERQQKTPIILPETPVLPAQNKFDKDNYKSAVVNAPRITTGGPMKI